MNINNSNSLVNIDKNLSYSYLHFRKYNSDESNLMWLLLVYFAKERQYNLFGFGTLDPIKFCEEMDLNQNHTIWNKVENPRQKTLYTEEEIKRLKIPLYDTALENALYCLSTDVYSFSEEVNKYLHKNQVNVSVNKLSTIQFIKQFERVTTTARNGKQRKLYNYVLSQEFLDNLSFIFFNADPKNISISIKKSYEGLYMHLCNLKNEMFLRKKRAKELEFDYITELLNINSTDPSYKKKKIIKAFAEILNYEDLKGVFNVTWFKKPNHKFEYGIELTYLLSIADSDVMEKKNSTWRDAKTTFIKNYLFEHYRKRYPSEVDKEPSIFRDIYIKWLKDSNIDRDIKQTAYVTGCMNFDQRNKYEEPGARWENFINELTVNYLEYL
ncbi:hypothetical protein [Elizabethkingia anophelis]|uniref:hypothetical protein n=1 Tax=Elizabethkingia anophelis TaxID=1117645 RepID=UPI0002AD0C0E|nr:hypothetical protein [Elizabethkingia anophelis]ELR81103.1 hypothetical protein D505_01045 [Elizabethkingia anophelis R26]MCS7369660.1 hypothetical protein [Elizabethkingia anophelis]MCS7374977.1 hypothetical protein [Elizabethkingia anophelis]MCS7387325.1 hypothetical protein [Elizabethkingia anophelis]HAY3597915.1 hypothetical protein [Elizabethkingia anophelis]